MQFIDTHSHLYSDKFNEDRLDVINNAIAVGVETILLPNISSKYTNKMLALCSEFPKNCYPMMGLHPCDVTEENYEKEITHVKEEIKKGKYIAIGEIGLDLYWEQSTIEIQKMKGIISHTCLQPMLDIKRTTIGGPIDSAMFIPNPVIASALPLATL